MAMIQRHISQLQGTLSTSDLGCWCSLELGRCIQPYVQIEIQDLSLTSSTGPQPFSIIFGPYNYLPVDNCI